MVFCYLPQFLRKYPRLLGVNEYVKWSHHTIHLKITFEAWWHHQVEIFFVLLALCAGNSLVTGEFPSQRPVTRSFYVYFDLRLNKRLSKQSWCRWFEVPLHSLWHHCNDYHHFIQTSMSNLWSGPLLLTWISNHMSCKFWDEITYLFPNFNNFTVWIMEWISNFISHFSMDIITNPWWE